jgi:intergrase/recombinase
MLGQRRVIRFLVKEGIRLKEIHDRLRNAYQEAVMKKTDVFFWVG